MASCKLPTWIGNWNLPPILPSNAAAGNLQALSPQATATTRQTITVPVPANASKGSYTLHLSAPDVHTATANDARFALRFANADDAAKGQAWDAASGLFKVGT